MQKMFFVLIVFISLVSSAQAEEAKSSQELPQGKPRFTDELNKESSSFTPDPDPLDPLPVKKESLKEDEDIILEDIKQVLKRPAPQKEKTVDASSPNLPEVGTTQTTTTVEKKKTQRKRNKSQRALKNLRPDEPDTKLELNLHQIYKTYNINPTSAEVWSKVTSERNPNVYEVQKGDNLFTISKILFGDSQFWPKIWALNKLQILNPHQITPGMKIYFFTGTDTELPTLALQSVTDQVTGQVANSSAMLSSDITVSAESERPGKDYTLQNTEFHRFDTFKTEKGSNENLPTVLPDSLPLYRNDKYYFRKKAEVKIQLIPIPVLPTQLPKNNYLLTGKEFVADYAISEEGIDQWNCKENQLVKDFEKVSESAPTGRMIIVERVAKDTSKLRSTIIYKKVGVVEVISDKELRIKQCDNLITADALIVSEEKISQLTDPNEVISKEPQIIEGLDFESQNSFDTNQFVVINSGNFNEGEYYSIYSNAINANVGQVKIVKRHGQLAIGIITESNEFIAVGDLIKDLATGTDVAEPSPIDFDETSENSLTE